MCLALLAKTTPTNISRATILDRRMMLSQILSIFSLYLCTSTDNKANTMLVRSPTVPHYNPKNRMTATDLKKWFTCTVDGLGVSTAVMAALKEEINDPSDLLDLRGTTDVESIQRSLGTRTYNADGTPKPTFKISNRVLIRLRGAIKLVNYLSMVRRDIHWELLKWSNLRTFVSDWDALVAITKNKTGEPPVWRRNNQTQTVSFLYAVADHLNTVHGVYQCPLGYLIDEDAVRDNTPAADAPPFAPGRYFSDKAGSLMAEVRARAPRDTASAEADNVALFAILTKCFQLSPFAAQAQPFEKTHDGMGFWRHLKTTNATDSHHDAVAKSAIDYCQTAKWDGSADLIEYIGKLRRQFAIYGEAGKHITLQNYDDRTRVGWFLDNMTCTDVNAITYITNIRHSSIYRDNWEAAMSYMSQCPYTGKNNGRRKRGGGGNNTAAVAGIEQEGTPSKRRRQGKKGKNGGGGGGGGGGSLRGNKDYQDRLKQSEGRGEKTGVDLRWHSPKEYRGLSKEERTELNQWRLKSPKKDKPDASVADAKIASLETKVDQQHGLIVSAVNALTSAINSAIPGARVCSLQAMVATEDEASPQLAGESAAAMTGQVSATGGTGDDDGDDNRKPSAVTFADVESDVNEQTRKAAAVGLISICRFQKKKD